MSQKLYKVTLIGLGNLWIGTNYKISYALAEDPTSAYKKVRDFLDHNNLGFQCDRELQSIELVAEEAKHPDCRTLLLL